MEERSDNSVLSLPAKDRLGDLYLYITSNIATIPKLNNLQYKETQLTDKTRTLSNIYYSRTIRTSHDSSVISKAYALPVWLVNEVIPLRATATALDVLKLCEYF